MRLTRTQRLILLTAALASCVLVVLAGVLLRTPDTVRGTDVAEPRAVKPAPHRSGARDNLGATTGTLPPGSPVPPAVTPPSTTPPVTTPPATTPPGNRPANYSFTFAGSSADACNAELNKLRSQGYTVGGDTACFGAYDVYMGIVSNGTYRAQIMAYNSGTATVGFTG